jgi:hypothetical protein
VDAGGDESLPGRQTVIRGPRRRETPGEREPSQEQHHHEQADLSMQSDDQLPEVQRPQLRHHERHGQLGQYHQGDDPMESLQARGEALDRQFG